MKKIQSVILLSLLFVASGILQAQHYYGNYEQIPLLIDSTKVAIKFEDSFEPFNQEDVINSVDRLIEVINTEVLIDNFVVCTLTTSNNYTEFLDSLRIIDGIDFVEPYYTNIDSSSMLVGTRFYVAFNTETSQDTIDSLCALYDVTFLNEIRTLKNVYVLKNNSSSDKSTLELSNLFHELEIVKYSHPEFELKLEKFSYNLYDHYHSYQPHTKKVIGDFNSASVWDFAGLTENAINVAVIDDGVTSHEDLPAIRILPGHDYSSGFVNDSDATPGDSLGHGMACAGIIAASHTTDSVTGLQTSSGMISLNPNANIVSIKVFQNNDRETYIITPEDVANAINESHQKYGSDILSISWGSPSVIYVQIIADAIQNAKINGRNGLGCPVICAAGNFSKPIGLRFPSSVAEAFSVASIQLDDYKYGYTSYGAGLDIVAPSGVPGVKLGDVWSLDQMGSKGANPKFRWIDCDSKNANCTFFYWDCPTIEDNNQSYYCNFGGTSAAAPVVSGVASLILAKDPTLTSEQVYEILRYSAVTDLDWGTITPPSNEYGYGRVDAFRAILSLSHGDVNNSGGINQPDISDMVYLVDFMFHGGPAPFPSELLADCDCSGDVDISDLTYLTDLMFNNGPPIQYPCFAY